MSGIDLPSVAAQAAQAHGLDPDFYQALIGVGEHGFTNAGVSPAGAVGPAQLMPGTARDMGVQDITDPVQNLNGGAKYAKLLWDRFNGDPALTAAAYNAGPAAVEAHGGVPPFKETQAYVQRVTGAYKGGSAPSADEIAKAYGWGGDAQPAAPDASQQPDISQASPSPNDIAKAYGWSGTAPNPAVGQVDPETGGKVVSVSHNGGVQVELGGKGPPTPPSVAGDVVEGFQRPWQQYGHDVAQSWRQESANALAGAPTTLGDTMRRAFDLGPAATAIVGLPNALSSSITGAVTRPIARAASTVLPQPYSAPAMSITDGHVALSAAQKLDPVDAAQSTIETALSGARPATPGWRFGQGFGAPEPVAKPMTLDELAAARDAKYAAVRAKGDVIPQGTVQTLADQFGALLKEKAGPDPKSYPASSDMLSRLKAMAADPNGVTLPQLDTLRSDLYDALIKPGDREQPLGMALRKMIDGTIAGTGNPDILAARDLHSRVSKIQTIQDEVKSAKLRAATSNSGQNANNAIRQELRPLIDPTRAQQIGNLTPEELKALTTAVEGSASQNRQRHWSNLLRNKFLQGVLTVPTLGTAPIAMEVGGNALNRAAEAGTLRNVQNVIDTIARGGAAPVARSPIYPTLALGGRPAISVASVPGAVGVNALARRPLPAPYPQGPVQPTPAH